MVLSKELINLRNKAIPKAVFQATSCVIDSAKGDTIIDVDGNEWIDFTSGIGVSNAGHCPDRVVAAIKAQADKFLHACFHISIYEGYIRLADKLNSITPGLFEKKTFFANSGAEAVENSIKIARSYTNRPSILCFESAFHGRTLAALSITSKVMPYKKGFGPFLPEVYRVPFPYAYRMSDGNQKEANQMVIESIKAAFKNRVDPETVAAIIFEPVQGEGGFVTADPDFFQQLRKIASQHSILLICDEIQTGFGRTGTLFAAEQLGIEYDIILSAKSLGAGLPISAITGKADIMDTPQVGGLGGTFGGNPLSCAAALASIEMFEQENLLASAAQTARIINTAFSRFKEKFECIGDVRGLGPMMALEIVSDRKTKEPAPELTRKLISFCHSNYLSIITAGTYGNVVRVLPPLNIEEQKLLEGLSIIEKGLAQL